jgi:hypothetical protein
MATKASRKDANLIRALAETLRRNADKATLLRSALASTLNHGAIETAFDVFGSSLPEEVFEGVFDQSRRDGWRKVEL